VGEPATGLLTAGVAVGVTVTVAVAPGIGVTVSVAATDTAVLDGGVAVGTVRLQASAAITNRKRARPTKRWLVLSSVADIGSLL
jgi:hypothetical protein